VERDEGIRKGREGGGRVNPLNPLNRQNVRWGRRLPMSKGGRPHKSEREEGRKEGKGEEREDTVYPPWSWSRREEKKGEGQMGEHF
jgi:hypothetical protein